ncbi:MAG: heavy-metal-associated domain-containing protein [Acholeplasmataceae bacterium]
MKTVTYKVSGMHCMGCANSIKRVLERNMAVSEAIVAVEDGYATVSYDEALINDQEVITLIKNLGYEAEVK